MPGKHVIEPGEHAGRGRPAGSVPSLSDRRRRPAPGSFPATSTTSRITAFPRLRLLDPAAQRLRVAVAVPGIPVSPRRGRGPAALFMFNGFKTG